METIVEKLRENRSFWATVAIGLLIIVGLAILPTGYEDAVIYKGVQRAVCKVEAIDNGMIIPQGVIYSGEQSCTLRVTSGKFKGRQIEGVNFLTGSPDTDKIYKVGDKAYVTISHRGGNISQAVMTDHYRLDKEVILLLLFFAFLVCFAGKGGIKAMLTFVIAIEMVWKVLVPAYLKGYNPVWVGIFVVILLTLIIIYSVYGWELRTFTAVLGSVLGIVTTCILGMIFTDLFDIHGAIMHSSVSLMYSGYENLDLTKIYMSSIFIGASGAMMDVAVDITSAVGEVVDKKPTITVKEAILSGMTVGKAIMGTMTTTLFLAYSGSYIMELMVFMAQGTPIDHIFNYRYVASEWLHTIVGSFGLVTVAPFTAVVTGFFLVKKKRKELRSFII